MNNFYVVIISLIQQDDMELIHLQSETTGTSGKLPNIIIDEFQIKLEKLNET
ncbi:hypothetical protein DICPUDRAFT_156798 [Dictyostelium purpureum]|uniref:Uncharacterized protein n=1 Tax=Dictyostelium purpureum TaxID=5786 RepID=F0ZXG7_DICPU|nr:uncharacterized protein DICPUDRAFT_156798 [Dictyostelium purpureum]EGC31367.1 hypothetical protein DICPUDRAFT_156798 [Dictyostelium purpureum]|eukprot:XP_003292115.1 hypothetical protein DICPUDRAFT_156798 [Dictyostelium purpureum]